MKIYDVRYVSYALIKDMHTLNKINYYNEPYSSYMPLIDNEGKLLSVSITKEINGIDKTKYYSVHCINQLNNTCCYVKHTYTTNQNELIEVLKDIIAMVLYNLHCKAA